MPIGSVFNISPVYDVISSVPGVSGAGDAAVIGGGGGGGGDGGPTAVLEFAKALYADGDRGVLVGYGASITLVGSVERKGSPTSPGEGKAGELRPLTQTTFEITTGEDPGIALGEPLETNDRVVWAGFALSVVGPAIPQGAGWITKAVLTI